MVKFRNSSETQKEFASFTNDYARQQIAFADTKAGVGLTLALGLLAYLRSSDVFAAAFLVLDFSWRNIFASLCALALAVAIVGYFSIIFPRLSSSSKKGLIFFEAVKAHADAEAYSKAAMTKNDAQLVRSKFQHTFDLSVICSKKYWWLRVSFAATLLAVTLALATYFMSLPAKPAEEDASTNVIIKCAPPH